jgi:UPF0716 family protein affecting phage T7 exclusion
VLTRGGIPNKELTDGFLILLGGALLLTPGFLTDIVGLVLILPPTRAPLKAFFRKVVFGRLAMRHPTVAGGVYTARVVRERRAGASETDDDHGVSPRGSAPPRLAPPEGRAPNENGSPGRE